ncbi:MULTISPECIES: sugar ABC transporter permease [Psychrilyobacter]|uniref:ABC transporter permease subunit n=1 Tax=Psychrilyobacter piezotolerans TaxID=2293438 RepID=A0ABX9KJV8_9FUSO|nr:MULTISPECIES: sugar ABC transporter permease [Psychrilyobacter]MCS5422496.1 sugar ABC transporter permease [Psychrilyobacter sp. S5]NDI76860.1 sugar ABC transporter permease [Psychrilyobacter piezotolerans]RDE65139.1 sugar ABC transporter permease [Psychrilyobacter sp. S5]REI42709.1 ABC transporter permease subunit [Psychrilyobacter piezotolerans]
MSKTKIIDKILDGLTYLGLILITLSVLLPLTWIVLSSMQVGNSLYSSTFLPKSLTLDHYKALFSKTDFPIWYMNTLKIATLNMILGVIITTLTAYTFSRYKFRGRKQAMIGMLVLQMFPSFLAMTAIYILITKMGLMDTHAGLLMVYIAGQIPYNSWLVKGYFDGIPKSLDEAARVDGAGHLTIFIKIIMPITKPIVVFVALTNFIGPWFDFIFPKLLLRSAEKKTLAVGIFEWISSRANDNFTQFAAASILIAVPIAVLFMYLQKHIVAGLSAGATKG